MSNSYNAYRRGEHQVSLQPDTSGKDEDLTKIRTLITLLIQRKQELYPDNKRLMLGYEFVDDGPDWQLNVMSTDLAKC